jgi:hypothetical protein
MVTAAGTPSLIRTATFHELFMDLNLNNSKTFRDLISSEKLILCKG